MDTSRKDTVKRLIKEFESNPNRDVLLKDFEKSKEINLCSQESKDLIAGMGNTEIFELNETSSKRTMPGLRLALGSWNRKLHMRQMHAACGAESTNEQRTRFDVLSILGYVIKEGPIPRC